MLIKNIQVLRALAVNAVLLAHLADVERRYSGAHVSFEWLRIGSGGVDLFFVISGYIIATVARDCGWREFLIRRLTRIYPLYWVYATATLCAGMTVSGWNDSLFTHEPALLRSYLLLPGTVAPILVAGWTLTHEIYFYLGFALIMALALPRRLAMTGWALLVVFGSIAVLGIRTNHVPDPTMLRLVVHPITMEFLFGTAISFMVQAGHTGWARTAIILGAACFLGTAALCSYIAVLVYPASGWDRVLFLGLPAALVVYGCVAGEARKGAAPPVWMVRIGDASYSTYLCHTLVIAAVGYLMMPVPGRAPPAEILFFGAGLVASNIIGLLSYKFIERPLIHISRGLFEPRSVRG